MPVERSGHRRLYGLDLLKTIGAAAIVLHHFQQDTGVVFKHMNFYGGHINFGFVVEMFFEISGMLVVLSDARQNEVGSPREQFRRFINRVMRIWPMLAISVLAYAPLCWAYYYVTHSWIFGWSQGLWSFFASLAGRFSAGAMVPIHGMNNPSWYLNALLVCYAAYYLLDFLADRWGVSHYLLFWGFMAVGLGVHSYGINLPFLQADYTGRAFTSFFLGTLIGGLYPWLQNQKWFVSSCAAVACITGCCIAFNVLIDNEWALFTFALWPSLIIVFSESRTINTLLAHDFITLLSASSFEVYLWHTPFEVLVALVCALFHVPIIATPRLFAVGLTSIEIIGVLLYLYLEVPITRRIAARQSGEETGRD